MVSPTIHITHYVPKQLFSCILTSFFVVNVVAQVPFTASWDFEGNRNGNSGNPNVTVSALNLSGVNELGYPAGVTGDAVSLGGWSTTAAIGDYVEFSISPQMYRISISAISFYSNRTTQGPTQLVVRSSVDGFGSNIGSIGVGVNFNILSIGQGLNNLETTTTYRIYGYSAGAGTGAMRIDNLKVSGTVTLVPLPVELLFFKAHSFEEHIELLWETAWEHNNKWFEVQRSTDLQEFITLETRLSKGNGTQKSQYVFIDKWPVIGTNYYRLKQTDNDGLFSYSKIISATLNTDSPQIWMYENPTNLQNIRIRLQNIAPENLLLFDANGRSVGFSMQDNSQQNYTLRPSENTPTGVYFLTAFNKHFRISKKIYLVE